jgi:hypothetical protein
MADIQEPTTAPEPMPENLGFSVTRRQDFDPVMEVHYHGNGFLYLLQGPVMRLAMEGFEWDLDHVSVRIEQQRLHIEYPYPQRSDSPKFFLIVPQLALLQLSGNGTLHSLNVLQSDDLSIECHDGLNCNLELKVQRLGVAHRGSGNIELKGHVHECQMELFQAGEIRTQSAQIEHCQIHQYGSGLAVVAATNTLCVGISGNGHVHFLNYPKTTMLDSPGTGRLINVN